MKKIYPYIKTKYVICLIIILLLMSGCTGSVINSNTSDNKQGTVNTTNLNSNLYKNKELWFSLVFPASWNGKYEIHSGEEGITVYYVPINKTSDHKAEFFSILIYGSLDEWINIFGDVDIPDGPPIRRIGVINNNVYIVQSPTDFPYDPDNEDEKNDAVEFDKMLKQEDGIIGSFKAINT